MNIDIDNTTDELLAVVDELDAKWRSTFTKARGGSTPFDKSSAGA